MKPATCRNITEMSKSLKKRKLEEKLSKKNILSPVVFNICIPESIPASSSFVKKAIPAKSLFLATKYVTYTGFLNFSQHTNPVP